MMKVFGKTMRRSASIFLAVVLVFSFSGCMFAERETKKRITTYFGESQVTAARYYTNYGDEFKTEELDASRVATLVEKMDSMTLKVKRFHTDYFWGGRYGIELDLADGTYITYDGTKLEHRSVRRPEDSGKSKDSTFATVTNMKFWEEMEEFFPSVKENPML